MTGRILVIKLGALGDFIQALGAMAAIRRHHAQDRITLMTTAPFASLGERCGYFDAVTIDARPGWHDLRGWWTLRRALVRAGYSRVYDLQNNDRTAIYLRLFGAAPPEWVGAAPGASHRTTGPARTAGHALDGHALTLSAAGIEGVVLDDLSWMQGDIARFGIPGPYALLVPGCSPAHPGKRWGAEKYAALAEDLSAQGLTPVVLGTRDDAPAAAPILSRAGTCVDLLGKTDLFDIPALARGATVAIGNDTGPIHMIAATGCPTLALFCGRSDPVRHGPKGRAVEILRVPDLATLSAQEVMTRVRERRSRNTAYEASAKSPQPCCR